MIRGLLTTANICYGFDVTNYKTMKSISGYYDNLLTEDLIERIDQGDVIIYFDCNESAEDWCLEHDYTYQLVYP